MRCKERKLHFLFCQGSLLHSVIASGVLSYRQSTERLLYWVPCLLISPSNTSANTKPIDTKRALHQGLEMSPVFKKEIFWLQQQPSKVLKYLASLQSILSGTWHQDPLIFSETEAKPPVRHHFNFTEGFHSCPSKYYLLPSRRWTPRWTVPVPWSTWWHVRHSSDPLSSCMYPTESHHDSSHHFLALCPGALC